MARMNYGPRFSQGGASPKYGYDELIDKDMRDNAAFFAGLAKQPLHKRELRSYNTVKKKKTKAAKTAPGPEREDAEKLLADAVRKCVEMLEFHMDAIQQHTKAPGRPHYCNPIQIHNVIWQLRLKCGVSFADVNTQYAERQHLEQRKRDAGEVLDDVRAEREQQRLSRLRNMKEQAERFAKYRKNTG